MKITIPFALGNILALWLIGFISLAFVGHACGQLELNACALALSTYVLIANSLMLGLNFGCDTLLPQCYGGNKRKMGLILQRAVLITGYSCFISWTLMLNAVRKIPSGGRRQCIWQWVDPGLKHDCGIDRFALVWWKTICWKERNPLRIIVLMISIMFTCPSPFLEVCIEMDWTRPTSGSTSRYFPTFVPFRRSFRWSLHALTEIHCLQRENMAFTCHQSHW